MTDYPVRSTETGCLLTVRVTPNASRDAIEGLGTDASGRSFLKVRVRAVPENGAANKVVCKVLAKRFGVSKSSIHVSSGETSRIKAIHVSLSEQEVTDILAAMS